MNRKELLDEVVEVYGMEWVEESKKCEDEEFLWRVCQRIKRFRVNWEMWDNEGIRVDSWEVDSIKMRNNISLFIVKSGGNVSPIEVVENGIWVECILQGENYQLQRYLYDECLYHIYIGNGFSYYSSRITGVEVHKSTQQPRRVAKVVKRPSDEYRMLSDLINKIRKYAPHYSVQVNEELVVSLEKARKMLAVMLESPSDVISGR